MPLSPRKLSVAWLALALSPLAAGCQFLWDDDEYYEPSDVEYEAGFAVERNPGPDCGVAKRKVRGACTAWGEGDECVATGNFCVGFCDGLARCENAADELIALTDRPTPPGGYCVPCLD